MKTINLKKEDYYWILIYVVFNVGIGFCIFFIEFITTYTIDLKLTDKIQLIGMFFTGLTLIFGFVQWRIGINNKLKEFDPYVVIDLDFNTNGALYLVLVNNGKSPAKDINIKFSPSFKYFLSENTDINELPSIKNISHLGTVRERRIFLGPFNRMADMLRNEQKDKFQIVASYSNQLNQKMDDSTIKIDLNDYGQVLYETMQDSQNAKLINAVNKIGEEIRGLKR